MSLDTKESVEFGDKRAAVWERAMELRRGDDRDWREGPAFVAGMRAQGVFESVALFSSSDFGRTLTSNGQGTGHGWAGNHLMYGGAVQGGKIYGKYPNKLGAASERAIRGKIVPTQPWEAMWEPIAEWMGVTDARDMKVVLPNAENFAAPVRLKKADVYK